MKKFAKGLSDRLDRFRSTIKGFDSSRQMALGATFGMLIGIIPKDSIFPYLLIVVLLLSRANLLTAFVCGMLFHLVGSLLDPITHEIGIRVLTFDLLEPVFRWLSHQVLVPWTRFNNSVVMGSLILGLIAAVPFYRLSDRGFERFGASIHKAYQESSVGRWISGTSHSKPAPSMEAQP